MANRTLVSSFLTSLVFCTAAHAADAPTPPKVTYQDHVLPLFRNACLNCHNPDKKKGDLDLSTYSGLTAGGGSGKVVLPGDADGSTLMKVITWSAEPNMPPKGDKLPDKDLATIRTWIASGAPENSGSKIAAVKPKTDLAVVNSTAGKPTGPIAYPKNLPLDPVAIAKRPVALNSIAASPWAPIVAIGGQKQIVLYNTDTLELLGVLPFPEGIPASLRFSRNGSLLLAGGGIGAKSGRVVAFDVSTGKRVTELGEEFDVVLAADITPDQSHVALGTPLRTLKLYSTSDGSVEQSVKKHTDWVLAVAFSPDGKLLASADRAGGMWVWEANTLRERYNCAGHRDAVNAVAFRGDSQVVASGSQDGTIKIWSMAEGANARTITGAHAGGVLSISFTHDGRLVSSGRDGQVKLWGADGAPLKTFERFNDLVLHVTFSHDGQRIIAGDYSGAIRVFAVGDAKPIGELTANPLTVKDRLAGFEQRLAALKTELDKANADVKQFTDAATAAAADLKGATDAQAAAAKSLETATANLAAAKAARDNAPALQAKTQSLAQALAKTNAARDAATQKLTTLQKQLATLREAAATAGKAAADAKAAADKKPEDKALAEAAKKAAATSSAKAAEVDALSKTIAAKVAESNTLTDTAKKAAADHQAAARAAQDAATAYPAAKAAVEKAKADTDAAAKTLTAKTQANQAAQEKLSKGKEAAQKAAATLEAAKQEQQKLKTLAAR